MLPATCFPHLAFCCRWFVEDFYINVCLTLVPTSQWHVPAIEETQYAGLMSQVSYIEASISVHSGGIACTACRPGKPGVSRTLRFCPRMVGLACKPEPPKSSRSYFAAPWERRLVYPMPPDFLLGVYDRMGSSIVRGYGAPHPRLGRVFNDCRPFRWVHRAKELPRSYY